MRLIADLYAHHYTDAFCLCREFVGSRTVSGLNCTHTHTHIRTADETGLYTVKNSIWV